jgi:serine/threonine protein kinase
MPPPPSSQTEALFLSHLPSIPRDILPSKIFARIDKVGQGAYGSVYKGLHTQTNHIVALKIIDLDTADDDTADIQREVGMLSAMTRNGDAGNNVTRYFGCWMEGPKVWIVMDYAEGGSFRTLVSWSFEILGKGTRGCVDWWMGKLIELLFLAWTLEEGRTDRGEIPSAHDARDAHRSFSSQQSRHHPPRHQRYVQINQLTHSRLDALIQSDSRSVPFFFFPLLLPSPFHPPSSGQAANILLTSTPRIILCDFGVSAPLFLSSSASSKRTTFVGTPYWMAPEVILAKPYDTKADIWGLGITVLELADKDGEPPLSREDGMRAIMMIPKMKPPRLPEDEGWSKEMKEFVAGCLNELPDEVRIGTPTPSSVQSGERLMLAFGSSALAAF